MTTIKIVRIFPVAFVGWMLSTSAGTAHAQSYSVTFINPIQGTNCKTGGTQMDFKVNWRNGDPPVQSASITPKLLKQVPGQNNYTDITTGLLNYNIGAATRNGNFWSIECTGTATSQSIANDPVGTKYFFRVVYTDGVGAMHQSQVQINLSD